MQAIFRLMEERKDKAEPAPKAEAPKPDASKPAEKPRVEEIGGRKGPDPTRYGDWEVNGRCVDF
jgi:hypothetical protein